MLANGNPSSGVKRGAALHEKEPAAAPSSTSSKTSHSTTASTTTTSTTTTTTTATASTRPSLSTSREQQHAPAHGSTQTQTQTQTQAQVQSRSWLATPAPIKRLFAHFPLQTLPANTLPRSPHDDDSASQSKSGKTKRTRPEDNGEDVPVLHIFSTPAAAAQGAPSFNPSCLQHQTWLRVHGVRTRAVSSSNHAAPGGVLPFLVRPRHAVESRFVSAAKMWEWAADQHQQQGESNDRPAGEKSKKTSAYTQPDALRRAREAAYLSLIEHRLRAAWLLALYLTPANFAALCQPLYIDGTTSAGPVRAALASTLRQAARTALHALSPPTAAARQYRPPAILPGVLVGESFPTTLDAQRIYAAAAEALTALATLLGEDSWFFAAHRPGRLDVVLFSYVHLLADESLTDHWVDRSLVDLLRPKDVQNLLAHRERMLRDVWRSSVTVVAPDGL